MQNVARILGVAGSMLIAISLVLIGCTPDTTAPTLQFQPTNAPPGGGDAALTTNVSSMMTRVPPFTDMACLECHTDQPALVELALPEDADHEALSSGPG